MDFGSRSTIVTTPKEGCITCVQNKKNNVNQHYLTRKYFVFHTNGILQLRKRETKNVNSSPVRSFDIVFKCELGK